MGAMASGIWWSEKFCRQLDELHPDDWFIMIEAIQQHTAS
jgi:hypothetical protein